MPSTGPIRLATDKQASSSFLRFQAFFLTISQEQSQKTHVPLNAPTGLRTGAATTSIIRCEVWKPRRAEIWAKLEVAGRAKAALRSAEGMRKAIVVVCVVGEIGLVESVVGWRVVCEVVCYARVGRVRVEMGPDA